MLIEQTVLLYYYYFAQNSSIPSFHLQSLTESNNHQHLASTDHVVIPTMTLELDCRGTAQHREIEQ
jgi:hypothetical protein